MVVRSHQRGNKTIINKDGKEFYNDDNLSTDIDKRCIKCKQMPTKEGHDACFRNKIPDARYACCGHGVDIEYILW